MIELGLLLLIGVAVLAAVMAVATIVKALLWIVLLPVRLVFWGLGALLLIPILLVKFLFGGLLLLIALPIVAISLVAAAAAVLVPLLPFLLLIAVICYLVKRQPAPRSVAL